MSLIDVLVITKLQKLLSIILLMQTLIKWPNKR